MAKIYDFKALNNKGLDFDFPPVTTPEGMEDDIKAML